MAPVADRKLRGDALTAALPGANQLEAARSILAKLDRVTSARVAPLLKATSTSEVDQAVALIENASVKLTAMIRTIRALEQMVHDLQQQNLDLQSAKSDAEETARDALSKAETAEAELLKVQAASQQNERDYAVLKSNIDRLLAVFDVDAKDLELLD